MLDPLGAESMTNLNHTTIEWGAWLDRWEAQQEAHVPDREERFDAMLDVLAALLPPDFVALDLACGPGSLARRLLERFPRARCVGVDLDPVLLALGKAALGDLGGRLEWVDADLTDPGWAHDLGDRQFDAVLSTTALHWRAFEPLLRLYRDLARVIPPGGVFLNGDHLAYPPHLETFRVLAEWSADQRGGEDVVQPGREDWDAWWSALADEPGLAELLAERERRLSARSQGEDRATGLDVHEAALRDAGFHEVGTIWQHHDNRILLGVRA